MKPAKRRQLHLARAVTDIVGSLRRNYSDKRRFYAELSADTKQAYCGGEELEWLDILIRDHFQLLEIYATERSRRAALAKGGAA